MSDPNHAQFPAQQQPAPGWYPDGTGAVRWWDGASWTAHTQAPAQMQVQPQVQVQAPRAVPLERPRLADHLPVDSVWTWIIALAPFLTLPGLFLIDVRGYLRFLTENDASGAVSYFAGTGILALVGWALTALIIVAAFRDSKRLASLGVVRPFHWAFAFLGAVVYLIGRHVVLRKVTRTAGWPLWANVAGLVVTVVVTVFWTIWFMQLALGEITTGATFS